MEIEDEDTRRLKDRERGRQKAEVCAERRAHLKDIGMRDERHWRSAGGWFAFRRGSGLTQPSGYLDDAYQAVLLICIGGSLRYR